jgi:hypothetical protein
MLFFKDKKTGKECFALAEDGRKQYYECIFSVCPNPACTCMTIDIDLTFMTGQNRGDLPKLSHTVAIDLDMRKLKTSPKKDLPSEEKAFGNLLLSQLGEDDFEFLRIKHFAYKNKITEAADINEIEGYFDYDEVELNGLMYAYNGILPYGDQILVNINEEKYLIVDQFCLLPKCKCTDATLDLVPAGEDAMKADSWCAFRLKYAKKHWAVMEDSPPPIPLDEIRAAIEAQHPDFYNQLLRRHEKSKKIYLNCRRKHYSPSQIVTDRKVGRNDPCPCGSGKKYKKCCLKSTKPIEFPDNRLDISGFQFSDDFKL